MHEDVIHFLEETPPARLITFPALALRRIAEPFADFTTSYLKDISSRLLDCMHVHRGTGLAATQVGLLRRVIVTNQVSRRHPCFDRVWINPEIFHYGEQQEVLSEACLSLPGQAYLVERATTIEIRYLTLQGERKEEKLSGWLARVVQHAVDHLEGVLVCDHKRHFGVCDNRDAITVMPSPGK